MVLCWPLGFIVAFLIHEFSSPFGSLDLCPLPDAPRPLEVSLGTDADAHPHSLPSASWLRWLLRYLYGSVIASSIDVNDVGGC